MKLFFFLCFIPFQICEQKCKYFGCFSLLPQHTVGFFSLLYPHRELDPNFSSESVSLSFTSALSFSAIVSLSLHKVLLLSFVCCCPTFHYVCFGNPLRLYKVPAQHDVDQGPQKLRSALCCHWWGLCRALFAVFFVLVGRLFQSS